MLPLVLIVQVLPDASVMLPPLVGVRIFGSPPPPPPTGTDLNQFSTSWPNDVRTPDPLVRLSFGPGFQPQPAEPEVWPEFVDACTAVSTWLPLASVVTPSVAGPYSPMMTGATPLTPLITLCV